MDYSYCTNRNPRTSEDQKAHIHLEKTLTRGIHK